MTDHPPIPEWVISRQVRIGKRLTVNMTIGSGGQFFCEWDPDMPRNLTSPEMKRYRRARDTLLVEFMQRKGLTRNGVVVEIAARS